MRYPCQKDFFSLINCLSQFAVMHDQSWSVSWDRVTGSTLQRKGGLCECEERSLSGLKHEQNSYIKGSTQLTRRSAAHPALSSENDSDLTVESDGIFKRPGNHGDGNIWKWVMCKAWFKSDSVELLKVVLWFGLWQLWKRGSAKKKKKTVLQDEGPESAIWCLLNRSCFSHASFVLSFRFSPLQRLFKAVIWRQSVGKHANIII